jgi:hypothetical protein
MLVNLNLNGGIVQGSQKLENHPFQNIRDGKVWVEHFVLEFS